jgi:hypothetical protein
MRISARLVVAAVVLRALVAPAAAQDRQIMLYPSGCAPMAPAPAPADAPIVIGIQDPLPRTVYGTRDLVIINTGTAGNIQIGQRFYIRRHPSARYTGGSAKPLVSLKANYDGMEDRPITTSGGLRIIAANERMSIGQIELGCDGIHPGDYLQQSPSAMTGENRAGESDLDFSTPSRVLYGDFGKINGGKGDLMFAEVGPGAAAGLRYGIFRDLQMENVPLAPIGEAVVVAVDQDKTLVLLTETRDSIKTGDLLFPHKR